MTFTADLHRVSGGLEESLQCPLNGFIVLDDQNLFHQDPFHQGVIVIELPDIRNLLARPISRQVYKSTSAYGMKFPPAKPHVSLASNGFARTLCYAEV